MMMAGEMTGDMVAVGDCASPNAQSLPGHFRDSNYDNPGSIFSWTLSVALAI